jgi:cysteine desulfuration protein SufE
MTIEETQKEIVEEFSAFEDWMDKYAYLIELGNNLEPIDPKYKIADNLIRGCQSRVWFHQELKDNTIIFEGESDALIVNGLVALLLRLYSGRTPKEILSTEPHFIQDIGLHQHLSPTRSNGLTSMVKQIKLYALAYEKMLEKKSE